MDQQLHIAQLERWATDGLGGADRYQRLMSNPLFPRAARTLARNMLDEAAGDEAQDGIFKDAGRYVAAMLAVHLHVSGGLTLPRLKQVSEATGLLSPGRARDILGFLLHLEFVEPASPPGLGGAARYVPTEAFMTSWGRHLRAALQAASVIEPSAELVVAAMHERETMETFARHHTQGLLQSVQTLDQSSPYVRVFMHRHAGNQVVWTLLTTNNDEDFPPTSPIPVSISGLARRFAVSRTHIARLFDEAEQEGLLTWGDGGAVSLEPIARDFMSYAYAGQLNELLKAAAKTARERPGLA